MIEKKDADVAPEQVRPPERPGEFGEATLTDKRPALEFDVTREYPQPKTAVLGKSLSDGHQLSLIFWKTKAGEPDARPVDLNRLVDYLNSLGNVSFSSDITCVG